MQKYLLMRFYHQMYARLIESMYLHLILSIEEWLSRPTPCQARGKNLFALLRHMRDSGNVNEGPFRYQFWCENHATSRWVVSVDIAVADLAVDVHMSRKRINGGEHRQLDDVAEISSNGSKFRFEIFKDLLDLSAEIVWTDQIS